jgi:hypothetical protein
MEKQIIQYALMEAIRKHDSKVTKYCLENGACLDEEILCHWVQVNDNDKSCHWVQVNDNDKNEDKKAEIIFEILMNYATDKDINNKNFIREVLYKRYDGFFSFIMNFLLKKGLSKENKEMVLAYSVDHRKYGIITAFIANGYNTRPLLMSAIKSCNNSQLEFLVSCKANLWVCQSEIINDWPLIWPEKGSVSTWLVPLLIIRYMESSNNVFFSHYLLVTRCMDQILQSDMNDINGYFVEYYKFVATAIHFKCIDCIK